jgi:hypothetical protein
MTSVLWRYGSVEDDAAGESPLSSWDERDAATRTD